MTIDPRYYQSGGQGYVDPGQMNPAFAPPRQWWSDQLGGMPGNQGSPGGQPWQMNAPPPIVGNWVNANMGPDGLLPPPDLGGGLLPPPDLGGGGPEQWPPGPPVGPPAFENPFDMGNMPGVAPDPGPQPLRPEGGGPLDPVEDEDLDGVLNGVDPDPRNPNVPNEGGFQWPDPDIPNPEDQDPGDMYEDWWPNIDPDTGEWLGPGLSPVIEGDPWYVDPTTGRPRWEETPYTNPWGTGYPPGQPYPRESANFQLPQNWLGEMMRELIGQGMSGDWADDYNNEMRHYQDQQNAYNLAKMLEDQKLVQQESRQDWLGPLISSLTEGVAGGAEGSGSGVGPVGAILRGLGQHGRYVEGGEDGGSGPMVSTAPPTEVSQPRRFTGMLPSSTSSRLGAAGEQFAQGLKSRAGTVGQDVEARAARSLAGQSAQRKAQAGQQGLEMSGLVTGMQRQAEALEDAKKRSKRGTVTPLLRGLIGQV